MNLVRPCCHGKSKYKREGYITPIVFLAADYLFVLLTAQLVTAAYGLSVNSSYIYLWLPLTFILFLAQGRAYATMQPIIYMVRNIFYGVTFALVGCVVALYFFTSWQAPRSFFLVFWLVLLVMVYSERLAISAYLKYRKHLYEDVILIGAGRTAERALHFFQDDLGYRYNVVGFLDDDPISEKIVARYKVLGKVEDAESVLQDSTVQTVIITAPGMERDKMQKLITTVQPHVRHLAYVPDLIGTPMVGVEAQVLFAEEILMLQMRNNLAMRRNRIYKRIFDLICTVSGGLLILPFLLIISVLVAIENKGTVIFAHRRIGKDGREFACYKFQTMIPNAQEKLEEYLAANPEARKEWEESFKLTNDPRVTRLGGFLRKTSLDELPQLWNVIKGDMSLVGPRPIVEKEIKRYGQYFREYSMVLPGITGMWQASGRSDTTYAERVAMDTWYVRNWSVWLDIMYLAKTFTAVIFRKGAY
ncbi:undecaprenyl-phosphate galactose phosphotransferase [Selenomonas sp. GACV-9]|uniref:undecaprenyl-phosphate galactose phosphotransferase WbaP n=1 Tax=Selenomonas sp. GACV-9 TaxID=3158782 RepID=UPI0008EC3A12|nr:undecaprenyl-phosphate galactose phosphotransferase [Selenomonas ruminantium]